MSSTIEFNIIRTRRLSRVINKYRLISNMAIPWLPVAEPSDLTLYPYVMPPKTCIFAKYWSPDHTITNE